MSSEKNLVPPNIVPLCVPEIRGNEWDYVKECLDSNWVSSIGPFVDRFEKMVAGYTGAKHAVAVASGTAALHVALLVAGVKPDDEVLVSALSFIAPANAVRYAGACPVFIDAERQYWQMDAEKVAGFLETECIYSNGELKNKATGRRVSAILPVHILGHPVDMDPILDIARRFGLVVIEDAAEGFGATYKGRALGTIGDIGCISFNGNKIVTTGGGGMVLTGNEEWARKAAYLTTQAKDDVLEYVHNEIGFNYRMNNMQAAMGCAQLEKIDEYVAAKRETARRYGDELDDLLGIRLMREAEWARSTFWLYTILVDSEAFGMDSRALLRLLAENGVQSRPLWRPLPRQKPYEECEAYRVEVADELYEKALSLPSSVGLTSDELERVCEAIRHERQRG